MKTGTIGSVMVIGGGITGMQTALDLAKILDCSYKKVGLS